MARRKGWGELSPEYRARLKRQGVTYNSYRRGADIRAARGHANEGAPRPARERRELIGRAVRGEATPAELRRLGARRPAWVPRTDGEGRALRLRPEAAAALSQLPPPDRWAKVKFDSAPDGQPWTMRVWTKRAKYPITIEVPGGGAEGTGAREVLTVVSVVRSDLERVNEQQGRARAVFDEPTVTGTP